MLQQPQNEPRGGDSTALEAAAAINKRVRLTEEMLRQINELCEDNEATIQGRFDAFMAAAIPIVREARDQGKITIVPKQTASAKRAKRHRQRVKLQAQANNDKNTNTKSNDDQDKDLEFDNQNGDNAGNNHKTKSNKKKGAKKSNGSGKAMSVASLGQNLSAISQHTTNPGQFYTLAEGRVPEMRSMASISSNSTIEHGGATNSVSITSTSSTTSTRASSSKQGSQRTASSSSLSPLSSSGSSKKSLSLSERRRTKRSKKVATKKVRKKSIDDSSSNATQGSSS
mmetsp:Transcript_22686/g.36590  ORF Transcript_22686/g.36590 Transcript_22686/m.36590 type:complete len:284 (+) Transcript_22686:498-1349(+)|eukprot:CAMPEP_0171496204 /NCGR_PEP_ID=MMETSP0958-20121227/6570_1 /TAXON_ID=87120 /ORGANISM="Aurantiochytrium limacinum, Strain ATCCMYA-1381" /LENGTH=283 /DNA_ID=CAMNT_0012030277 /DNA_START=490 /DNA_END=1341 /DNA_ORIENTATION=+